MYHVNTATLYSLTLLGTSHIQAATVAKGLSSHRQHCSTSWLFVWRQLQAGLGGYHVSLITCLRAHKTIEFWAIAM